MKNNGKIFKKRIIVFGFEGKNNKTETNYFSHFLPIDEKYILKPISAGVTDLEGMIKSIKDKRKNYDYDSKIDLTYIFVDDDCSKEKRERIEALKKTLPKDITIIRSSPMFELWFLNHFCKTTKGYLTNDDLINDLKKFIPEYEKNLDCFDRIKDLTTIALANTNYQIKQGNKCTSTDVGEIIDKLLKFKN